MNTSRNDAKRVLLRHDKCVPPLEEPLKLALIGAGGRSTLTYAPLWQALQSWVRIVAVCDPLAEHADKLAGLLNVPAYHDLRRLVRDMPMEAALVVSPVPSHHSISVFLSTNGIHNLTETSWSSMLCQSREMIATARRHGVVVRVAENFFRFPIDRFAQTVRDSGYLGRIGRVLCYADHTGYHNNSRWIALARNHPLWVQSIEHAMDIPAYYATPQRRFDKEWLRQRCFAFPGDLMVVDTGSGNVKGHLGRHPRPGYTEWQGQRGTLVHRATGPHWARQWARAMNTELRRVSDDKLAPAQEAAGELHGGGVAEQITPVKMEVVDDMWARTYADTPLGRIEYVNPMRPTGLGKVNNSVWYHVAIMDHVADFALTVRGLVKGEFDEQDAMASQMMEIGAKESALQDGKRIALPLEGECETDALIRQGLRREFGVDPMDVEAMVSVSFPRL